MSSGADQNSGRGLGFEVVVLLITVVGAVVYYLVPVPDIGGQRQASASQAAGAALVIQQSSHVYDAMIRCLNDGAFQGPMTLDANPTTGVFSDFFDAGRPPVAHPGFFENPGSVWAKWSLNPRVVLEARGQEWYGVMLPGIKKVLCQKLNAILHKDDLNAEPVLSVYTKEQWISGSVELKGSDPRLARRDGCAAATDGEYVFYRAMIRR